MEWIGMLMHIPTDDDAGYGDIDTDPPSTCVGDQYVNQTSRVSCPLLIT